MKFTLTVNNDEESLMVASLASAAWAELGFDVKVKAVSYVETEILDSSTGEERVIIDSAIQSMVKDASYGVASFDVIAVDWQLYSSDAFVSLAAFTSGLNGNGMDILENTSRKNISGWWNADYNSYVGGAFTARDDETRMSNLAEAEKILLDESPIIPIVFNQSFAFLGSELSEITFDGFGNLVFNKAELENYHDYLPKEDNPSEEE